MSSKEAGAGRRLRTQAARHGAPGSPYGLPRPAPTSFAAHITFKEVVL